MTMDVHNGVQTYLKKEKRWITSAVHDGLCQTMGMRLYKPHSYKGMMMYNQHPHASRLSGTHGVRVMRTDGQHSKSF
jgi:hypothetical protein